MKLGIQCYGLQNMPQADPMDFFKGLYRMGYRLAEPFICFGKEMAEVFEAIVAILGE